METTASPHVEFYVVARVEMRSFTRRVRSHSILPKSAREGTFFVFGVPVLRDL
jgi:hypothetical protein